MRSSWPAVSPVAPRPVRWPVMYQTWSCISLLHWSYPVEVVARPPGLAVHELDGRGLGRADPVRARGPAHAGGAGAALVLALPRDQRPHLRGRPRRARGAAGPLPQPPPPLAALHPHRAGPGPGRRRARALALHRAVVREPDSALITAGGLPAPEGEPVAHWSPGVRTRISAWRPLGRSGR